MNASDFSPFSTVFNNEIKWWSLILICFGNIYKFLYLLFHIRSKHIISDNNIFFHYRRLSKKSRNLCYQVFTGLALKMDTNSPLEKISTHFGRSRAHDINHPSFIFKPLHSPSANSSTIMFNFQSRKTTFIVSSVDQVLIKVVWSQKVFHFGTNLQKKMPNHNSVHFLFMWIVLRVMIWHIFWRYVA